MKNLHARELSRNQPILRFDVILQHDWPIEQCLLYIRVFFSGKTKVIFSSFHPLADKTNNEHLPKPFFKVIRKSLHFRSVHSLCPKHLDARIFNPVESYSDAVST